LTLRALSSSIVANKITKIDLSKREVLMLLQRLIYECNIERLVRRVNEPGWEDEDEKELEGEGEWEDWVEYDTRPEINEDYYVNNDNDNESESDDDDDDEIKDEDDDLEEAAAAEKKKKKKRVAKTKIVYYCVREMPQHTADKFCMWEVLHEDFAFRTMQIGGDGIVIERHEEHHHTAEKTTSAA